MEALNISIIVIVGFLILTDLLIRFFPNWNFLKNIRENPLRPTHFIGIAFLLLFVVWPQIQEAGIGSVTFKKVESQLRTIETKVTKIETSIEELLDRYILEVFKYEDIEKNFHKGEKINYLKITLKHKPVKNSVMVWFGDSLTNPTNYTIDDSDIIIDLVEWMDLDVIKNISENSNNIIVISYIKISSGDKSD